MAAVVLVFFILIALVPNHFRGETNTTSTPGMMKAFSALRHLDQRYHSSCGADVVSLIEALLAEEPKSWALNMADSFGKPMSKLTLGNWRWPGSYRQCLRVTQGDVNSTEKPYKGQYCWASISLNSTGLPDIPELKNATPVFQSGICVPDSCSQEMLMEIANLLPEFLPSIGYNKYYNVSNVKCLPKLSIWDDSVDISAVFVCFIFACLIGSSTILDVFSSFSAVNPDKKSKKPGYNNKTFEVLKAFSAYTNLIAIFNTKSDQKTLHCVNGLRVLSLVVIMHGHTWLDSVFVTDSISLFSHYPDDHSIIWSINYGWPIKAVDSFLVISGVMVAYNFLHAHDRSKGRIPWVHFYVHRYVRLTPVYLAVIFVVYSSLGKYSMDSMGPFAWDIGSKQQEFCREKWWWNLLYIQNFEPAQDPQCISHSWYLAMDFQMYAVSPVFLIAFTKSVRRGLILSAVAIIATCSISAYLGVVYDVPLRRDYVHMPMGGKKYNEMFSAMYNKPYARIAPYIVGLLCGWFLQRNKCKLNCKNKALLKLGSALAAVIFIGTNYTQTFVYVPLLPQIMVHGFGGLLWGLMVAWVITVCCTGHGGIVNSFLSLPIWTPLCRLSYTTYIIHVYVVASTYLINDKSIAYSTKTSLVYSVTNIVASFVVALPFSLAFEAPIAKLEQVLLGARKSNKKDHK